MAEVWFSPMEIMFSRVQCIWIIEQVLPLPVGEWPPEPVETGYTDATRISTHSCRAPFEAPCQITGELCIRLSSTGEAGEALVDEIWNGTEDYEFLSRPAKRALNYISGIRRRRMNYLTWVRQNKYRQKMNTKSFHFRGLLTNHL